MTGRFANKRAKLTAFIARAMCLALLMVPATAVAQPADPESAQAIETQRAKLKPLLEALEKSDASDMAIADVAVYAKAAEWIVRHNEFYKPDYAQATLAALETGLKRAAELDGGKGKASWDQAPGRSIRGYRSKVDGSIQPYAVSLPADHGKMNELRWPLHIVLHGRGDTLNEVAFIRQHDGKPVVPEQDWIQLDVFGRTNNAYRWAGETDVFEAFADVRRRFRIDDRRVVLHGFSMGGAGSWHIGLHHPSQWCSVGPGAGFVDFYKYQKVETPLPAYQDATLKIYDATGYVLNAANVPLVTYGGEQDAQLVASTSMVDLAKTLNVPMKLIVGPGVGHKFEPNALKEFMAFHHENQTKGREAYPGDGKTRFITYTLKYNTCNWLTIHEMPEVYKAATIESERDAATGVLKVKTDNISVLAVSRDLAEEIELDGDKFPLTSAADGLLPDVYFEGRPGAWQQQSYDQSLSFAKNNDRMKRHNLQGPIDDAFMEAFVCVKGTGTPWSEPHQKWANWTLDRFAREFDKGMRGSIPIIDDTQVNADVIADKNLILFGDPGSNAMLGQFYKRLPLRWTKEVLEVNNISYDPATHGVALIYPNPMNPRRYVVVNSGHTFHEEDFKKSNAWLFPRLGDIAVLKFEPTEPGYKESIVWAEIFNSAWRFPGQK